MAGSYKHAVDGRGNLYSPKRLSNMIENGGDVFETVEEMYGMIWYLAGAMDGLPRDLVEEARQHYQDGLGVAKRANGADPDAS
jgi:hypothetical protein